MVYQQFYRPNTNFGTGIDDKAIKTFWCGFLSCARLNIEQFVLVSMQTILCKNQIFWLNLTFYNLNYVYMNTPLHYLS